MKFKILVLCFSFAFAALAEELSAPSSSIDLNAFVDMAKKASLEYQFKAEDFKSKEQVAKFEYASFLPKADFRYQNGKSTVDINKTASTDGRFINVNPELRTLSAELDVSVHKIIPKINSIRLNVNLKNEDKNIFENDFELTITRIYLEVIKARNLHQNAKEYVKALARQVSLIEEQFKGKLNSTINLNESLKRLAMAKSEESNRKSKLIDIEKEYLMLVGVLHRDMLLPEADQLKFKSPEEYLSIVESGNSKIKQSLVKNNLALSKLILASLEFSPNASLSYTNSRESQVWYYLGTPAVVREMFLFNVSVPISDGGRAIQMTASAYYDKKISNLEAQFIKKKVLQEAQSAWEVYNNNAQTFKQRAKAVQKASENVELRKKEINSGLNSLYFLLESEQDYIIAKNQYIESQIDFLYSYFVLNYYAK